MPQPDPPPAGARADLCRLLAACYYEPDAAFDEERLFDSMLEAAGRIDPVLAASARRLGAAYEAQGLPALVHDYQRLFGGASPVVNPRESAWVAGGTAAVEDAAMSLMGQYDEAGFEADDDESEGADHVAVQLEFLWLLIARHDEAGQAALAQVADSWEQLRAAFVARHLGAWIPSFATALQAGAGTPFYRDLAQLTRRFVELEAGTARQESARRR